MNKSLIKQYEKAILIRQTEEKLLELFSQGKLNGTVHTCIGAEFSAVAVTNALLKDDFIVSNHRGHGHYIARTGDLFGLFSEVMGKQDGCSGGMGGSQHLFSHNFLSNGIQGGMLPIAAGFVFGKKLKGINDMVSVAFVGDGTLGQGIVYETWNIVSKWDIPLITVIENNSIAQSTDANQTLSGSIKGRVQAFGIEYFSTTTNDVPSLLQYVKKAIDFSRDNQRPCVIEIETQRLKSHSKSDDNRDPMIVEKMWDLDPISIFSKENSNIYEEILFKNTLLINANLIKSEASPVLQGPIVSKSKILHKDFNWSQVDLSINDKRGNELIYNSLRKYLDKGNSFILGEDIETKNDFNPGEYGGAFKVTKDLSLLFDKFVRNTPISEQSIAGIATGISVSGIRTFLEIMFGDFMTLTLDQILQHASKFHRMYNNQVSVPLVIRAPMGGYRGYGPTHSQSLEKFFLGIPDLTVVSINHRVSPEIIYDAISTIQDTPVIVIENKVAYTTKVNDNLNESWIYSLSNEEFPTLKVEVEKDVFHYVIICFGGVLKIAEDAIESLFFNEELIGKILCLSEISSVNVELLKTELKNNIKILIVEEGSVFSSWSSEIGYQISRIFDGVEVVKMGNENVIPCSIAAELNTLPSVESITSQILS
jgi:2-oxoisovalerate dehydrogenase E1 component